MHRVHTIRVLEDNLVYLWEGPDHRAVVVDPGQAEPVWEAVQRLGLAVEAILLTHHDSDHVGGVGPLRRRTGAAVIGPDDMRLPGLDRRVGDGDVVELLGTPVTVLATPGHTRSSVCYHVRPPTGPGWVWTGDTLFVGGCGRPMECPAEMLWDSLQRLAALPDDTVVHPGHDYTAENRAFACSVAPEHPALQAVARDHTAASTIGRERRTNVFLLARDAADFARLRRLKNRF